MEKEVAAIEIAEADEEVLDQFTTFDGAEFEKRKKKAAEKRKKKMKEAADLRKKAMAQQRA